MMFAISFVRLFLFLKKLHSYLFRRCFTCETRDFLSKKLNKYHSFCPSYTLCFWVRVKPNQRSFLTVGQTESKVFLTVGQTELKVILTVGQTESKVI